MLLTGADYPMNCSMDLLPALSSGPGTTCESRDVTVTAMELNQRVRGDADYPSEDVDVPVDDLISGREDLGFFKITARSSDRPMSLFEVEPPGECLPRTFR